VREREKFLTTTMTVNINFILFSLLLASTLSLLFIFSESGGRCDGEWEIKKKVNK
jgi:hypothetical protein